MSTIEQYLGQDHDRCDELFVAAEQQAAQGDWVAATERLADFLGAIERHFTMEEAVLFPGLETVTGGGMGPTQVMRHEHAQMRGLFSELEQAAAQQDLDGFLGGAETLLVLMQQHNAKEEQILYRMADRVLAGERDTLIGQMEAVTVA